MAANRQSYISITLAILFFLSPIFEYQLSSLPGKNSIDSLKQKLNSFYQFTFSLKNKNEFEDKNPDNKPYACSYLDNYHLNEIPIHTLIKKPAHHIQMSKTGHSARSPTYI